MEGRNPGDLHVLSASCGESPRVAGPFDVDWVVYLLAKMICGGKRSLRCPDPNPLRLKVISHWADNACVSPISPLPPLLEHHSIHVRIRMESLPSRLDAGLIRVA